MNIVFWFLVGLLGYIIYFILVQILDKVDILIKKSNKTKNNKRERGEDLDEK